MIGFEKEQYLLDEQADPYKLTIKVLSPPASLLTSASVQVTAVPGNATSKWKFPSSDKC